MKRSEYGVIGFIPRIVSYSLFREFGITRPLPINITVSITDVCNFMCKTCNIGRLYLAHPELSKNELTVDEYAKIFRNLGKVLWVTVTGGEPFFRKDLAEAVSAINREASPKFMTIATNGYTPKKIADDVTRILQDCKRTRLVVNISLDGLEPLHDEIRGMKNSFSKVVESYWALKNIGSKNLTVGINTVISRFNIHQIDQIVHFINNELKPDSYICEVAENRAKLYNEGSDITPVAYDEAVRKIMDMKNMSKKPVPTIVKLSRRIFYKSLLSRKTHKCFTGFASASIMPKGDVWLGYVKQSNIGNLRDAGYDFRKLWFSDKANFARSDLKKPCGCMLANSHYTNLMCDPLRLIRAQG